MYIDFEYIYILPGSPKHFLLLCAKDKKIQLAISTNNHEETLQASAQALKKPSPLVLSFPPYDKTPSHALLQWVAAEALCSIAGQPICLQESRLNHKCIFNALVKAFT